MFGTRKTFFVILLHLIVATPQINLYFTDWVSESDYVIQHDCLRLAAFIDESNVNRQIISYCMGDSPSKFNIQEDGQFPKFTFAELSKQNITSQQLYQWSAPIDTVEHYQFYLNQLSNSNNSSLARKVFYNCTIPRFGPLCQYEFDYYHSSLYTTIHDFYLYHSYDPIGMTCYTHLQCDRGPFPSCLDWSEICDGKIDCRDGQFDEEYCWELEINECKDNEYRCANGQCIPKSFYLDDYNTPDCLDQSDEHRDRLDIDEKCKAGAPVFGCEDITCTDGPLTSSCMKERTELLIHALYSLKDTAVSNDCWLAFKCATGMPDPNDPVCYDLCKDRMYLLNIIEQNCSDVLFIPAVPVLFNDIYFAYTKNDAQHLACGRFWFPYRCYNHSRCDDSFLNNSKVIFNNVTCYRSEDHTRKPHFMLVSWLDDYVIPSYTALRKYNLITNYTSAICNRSNMYQCNGSPKCISIHRLMDGIDDCPGNDDEDITRINHPHVIERVKQSHYKCQASNKYIPQSLITDGKCDCEYLEPDWCEDEDLNVNYIRRNISFQTICDGYSELLPMIIDGQNQTDETECEQWLCNNIYTHCDGLWQCSNGIDEVGCYLSSPLDCSVDEHICISPHTNQFTCLPITKANDGHVDCLGATDEPNRCYNNDGIHHSNNFYCMNTSSQSCINSYQLCNVGKDCIYGDDEQFCNKKRLNSIGGSICYPFHSVNRLDIEHFLCENTQDKIKNQIVYFSLGRIKKSVEDQTTMMENTKLQPSAFTDNARQQQQQRCHRGLDLRIWLDGENNLAMIACLCPPSYYGDRCQYQNERVSLSIQFRASSHSWQTPFAIVISLIDENDNRIIHSYEQFTYLSSRDCKIKFNVYLIYSTRPKNPTQAYAIQIDIYEKISLDYRGSVFIPITFSFLPVHRLAFIIDIPRDNDIIESCSNDPCHHGKCLKYFNNPENMTFCQCDQGWSGRYCTIPHLCFCSTDSVCIGVTSHNRSVCVCPIDRFGPRCLLIDPACSMNGNSTCENGGQCIPNDEYIESNQKFTCICPKGFIGNRCEIVENKILLSFGSTMILPQSIFIHFIRVMNDDQPRRATTFRTIPFKQDSITMYWSQPFHLVFIEFPNKNYYLTAVQKNYNQSTMISKVINPSDRCRHINEIFNKTVLQLHLLRRIKYYQLPCQIDSSNLSCFYDDVHFCLCQSHGQQRVANCFEFDHNKTFDCFGQSVCENGAQCFQDTPNCPQRSMCVCSPCFYGTRCQFSTSGLGLSLDAILGYHIQPHVNITKQPGIIQISVVVTILFMIIGLVNGIFAMITFKNKSIREVGCGLYLLGSASTTLLITIMFGLKFWIFLIAQLGLIMNRSFLLFQCHSIDFLLRICLNMDQWLNALVAIERAITAVKGTRFSKRKSKQAAKIVIIILLIFVVGTGIQDPIYRRLIDEENEDEKRIWCIVSYSSNLQMYNSVIQTFHFIAPFIFNFISAIILITKKSRQLLAIQTHRTYKQLLREQIRQHKHLVLSPIVLVILALPRLIISFVSKCMKSTSDSWLFLAGYFISLIPPMLTFVVFILPSKFYMKEFHNAIVRYRIRIQSRSSFITQRLLIRWPNRIHPTTTYLCG